MTTMVKFFPGDGTEQMVEVLHLAGSFARGPDGACAFCHGDPCNESPVEGSLIAEFYGRNPHAETCPMCDGRPS
jgi:hypothetical protein